MASKEVMASHGDLEKCADRTRNEDVDIELNGKVRDQQNLLQDDEQLKNLKEQLTYAFVHISSKFKQA